MTRRLIDIESITGNEKQVGDYVHELLAAMTRAHGGKLERMEVEPGRHNIFASFGSPTDCGGPAAFGQNDGRRR